MQRYEKRRMDKKHQSSSTRFRRVFSSFARYLARRQSPMPMKKAAIDQSKHELRELTLAKRIHWEEEYKT